MAQLRGRSLGLTALAWTSLACFAVGAVLSRPWVVVAVMGAGWSAALLSLLLLRRSVTVPLHRIAESITAMRRSGRLVKLPVTQANELGVVAEGFNQLAGQVEEQKQRLRSHIIELQRVNLELDRLANLKDDFLTTINHQLRTPLTAIIEGVELLQDGAMGMLATDQLQLVQAMDRNAIRLASLIEDVLDLSLLKSGRRPLQPAPGDLGALLRQAQAAWQAAAQSRKLAVNCGELPQVYMDAEAIRDVMDHLLRNALRHAPDHSDVEIAASCTNDGLVEVSVRDHGPGIAAEGLARLFQPFVHVQAPEAPGSQGSGLGLAFCRQVIERHRGTIRAESAEGAGTTFTFTLPVASTRFVFQEACRLAREEAEYEDGQFGLVLVLPASANAGNAIAQAGELLRHNTHRGDQFVWLDSQSLVIVAVTGQPGLEMMVERLRRLLESAHLEVRLGVALFPRDGGDADHLLGAARAHLIEQRDTTHGTMRQVIE